jgi:DNA replication protein DnaC
MNIKEILNDIRKHSDIKRIRYEPYKMELSLKVWKQIGESLYGKYDIDKENEFVIKNIIRWIHGASDEAFTCHHPESKEIIPADYKKGFYIAGNTGSGKTAIMEIANHYMKIDNVSYLRFGKMNGLRFKTFRTDKMVDHYRETGDLKSFKESKNIGINDLGSEPIFATYMGSKTPVLQSILEYRGDHDGNFTNITSNLPYYSEIFMKRYGDRVISRLTKMVNYFELTGKDRRSQMTPT